MLLGVGAGLSAPQMTMFLLSLALMLGLARLLGEVARRWNQPAVLGEILAGVILGPTVLGYISPTVLSTVFPAEGPVAIALTSFIQIAVTFLLLVAGLEVDLSSVWRQGKAAAYVSIAGAVVPFAFGFGIAWLAPALMGMDTNGAALPFALFVGVAMSITALPVIAKILMDLNMFKSDMGALIMSAAMVNDLMGWLGFAVILAMIGGEGGGLALGGTIALTMFFVAGMLLLGRPLVHRTLPFVQAHSHWPGGVIGFVLVVALLCAAATEWIGIHAIFGAFIAGVVIGDSSHLRERTRDNIHQFITNIFAPVFFASIGLRVNFVEAFDLVIVLVVLVIALAGKIFGCYFGAVWAGMGKRESWATGFGMSARGAMEIILAQLAYEFGLITNELFVAIVIMALVTSMLAGPLMQRALRQKQRRSLKDFLGERHLIMHPVARTLEGAIREMSSRAAEITGLRAGLIHEAVMQRERIMHTGLPGGLAVPHARLDDLAKPFVLISLHRVGVDFDAPDGQLAHFVCLLLTPTDQPDTQIELLDLVVRTLTPETRAELLRATTPTEYLAVLNQKTSEESERAMVEGTAT